MGVAVEESVQCCSFYSLCNKSLELVKGTFKLQGVQMIIGHANKNFDLAFGGGGWMIIIWVILSLCIMLYSMLVFKLT